MGLDMGAYQLKEITIDGFERFEFAPRGDFGGFQLMDDMFPVIRLCSKKRLYIKALLEVDFKDDYFHIKNTDVEKAYQKIKEVENQYSDEENYKALLEFFRICSEKGHYVTAC